MPARVVWSGLNELKSVLQQMPQTMAAEAGNLSEANANGAALDVRSAYAVGPTGTLQSRVQVVPITRGPFRTGRVVKSLAPHAHLYESGTKPRRTKEGWNRGVMPARRVFIPRIIKWRRRFIDQLKAAIVRHGASRVTGG